MDLLKIISDFKNSQSYKDMLVGERYFKGTNDIIYRSFHYTTTEGEIMDRYRANNKVSDNFFKIITEQKVNYVVGNEVIIQNSKPYLDVNEEIDYLCEEACMKAVGWLHVYIDEIGELKQVVIPSEQVIPRYTPTLKKELMQVIRFYKIGESEIVEVWDNIYVTYYTLIKDQGYVQYEQRTHFSTGSFGKVPFIPLYNNRYEINDLNSIKVLIDCYDVVMSDFCNNFEDFQQVLYKLVNYAKTVDDEQMACELFEFIKKYGFVNVADGGDFDIIQREVPYLARKELLQIIKQNLYLIAQAVDPDILRGNSLTNVVIEASYTLLELKANKFIKMIKKFLRELLYFDNFYRSLKKMAVDDMTKVSFDFNKAILMNKAETVETLVLCVQNKIMSIKTAVTKNPYIDNADEEMLLLKEEEDKEQEKQLEIFPIPT